MSGFLDNYGAADAKRESKWLRIAGGAVAVVFVSLLGYWFIHNFQERSAGNRFIELLQQKNYDEAYRLWGCDPAAPCRDYNKKAFLDDWGPQGLYGANPEAIQVKRIRACSNVVLFVLRLPGGKRTTFVVSRDTRTLGFAPPTPADDLIEYCVDPLGRYENVGDKVYHVWDRVFPEK